MMTCNFHDSLKLANNLNLKYDNNIKSEELD